MLLRALIVLLLMVNLGVAAWWGLHAPAPPQPAAELPAGVARLQLLREAPPRPVVPALPASARCFSVGPFATPDAARAAQARQQPELLRLRAREAEAPVVAWRVFLPPQSSVAEAQAIAAQLAAVGIRDVAVVTTGEERNGVALGRYASRDLAQRRQAALQAAGFAALLAPAEGGERQWWLDVAAGETFDDAATARELATPPAQPIDCAALRGAGATAG